MLWPHLDINFLEIGVCRHGDTLLPSVYRNDNTILDQEAEPIETRDNLKDLIKDLIRTSWNAARFMEGGKRITRQNVIRTL